MEKTTIELTEEEAKLFAEFRKYQDQFKRLLEAGVFGFFVGSKTVHKDGKTIRQIQTTLIQRF